MIGRIIVGLLKFFKVGLLDFISKCTLRPTGILTVNKKSMDFIVNFY